MLFFRIVSSMGYSEPAGEKKGSVMICAADVQDIRGAADVSDGQGVFEV